jgi:hypothetical protein
MEKTMRFRAKETQYKGYRFRSRTEAKWAVFFDGLGIVWDYEPEGFVLDDGSSYLPDFWLPIQSHVIPKSRAGHLVEIKGTRDQADETAIEKARQLARGAGHRVIIFCGDPLDHIRIDCERAAPSAPYGGLAERPVSLLVQEQECRKWAFDSLYYYKRQDGIEEWHGQPLPRSVVIDAGVGARSARFEHGQVGAPAQWTRG